MRTRPGDVDIQEAIFLRTDQTSRHSQVWTQRHCGGSSMQRASTITPSRKFAQYWPVPHGSSVQFARSPASTTLPAASAEQLASNSGLASRNRAPSIVGCTAPSDASSPGGFRRVVVLSPVEASVEPSADTSTRPLSARDITSRTAPSLFPTSVMSADRAPQADAKTTDAWRKNLSLRGRRVDASRSLAVITPRSTSHRSRRRPRPP